MLGRCSWYYSFAKNVCTYPHCDNEARFTCTTHGYEGHVCAQHRGWHRSQWVQRKSEMDSQPKSTEKETVAQPPH